YPPDVEIYLDGPPRTVDPGQPLDRTGRAGEEERRRDLPGLQHDPQFCGKSGDAPIAEPRGPDAGLFVGQELRDSVDGVRDHVVEKPAGQSVDPVPGLVQKGSPE